MKETKEYARVTELNGIPPFSKSLPLAMQHVVAMIVGCVSPAIILAGTTGLSSADQVRLIQASLLISGIATLIQLFPLGKLCGSGLPVIMGASFAHVPLLTALGAQFGIPTVLGAQLAGGVVAVLVGLFYHKLSRIFTPPMYFGIHFEPTAVISMAIMYVIGSLEIMGDFTSTAGGGLDREVSNREMTGGIIGNGIISILGSFFGGLPTATFSQNVGIVIMTKVVNRFVLGLAAVLIVCAGLIPKFSAILTTIPSAVLGGATISVFAMIAMTGIRLVVKEGLNTRNTAIVGLSVALGSGVVQVADCFALFPEWARTIFGTSPVVLASIAAVSLNLLLPKNLDEN